MTNTSKSKKTTSTTRRKKSTSSKNINRKKTQRKHVDYALKNEAFLICILALAVFVFLCIISVIQGPFATAICNFMFGTFGIMSYILPIIAFVGFAFGISNRGNSIAIIKIVSSIIFVFLIGVISFLLFKQYDFSVEQNWFTLLYSDSKLRKSGSGILFGALGMLLYKLVGFWGTLFICLVLMIICGVFVTEKSFISGMKKGSKFLLNAAKEERSKRREYFEQLELEQENEATDNESEISPSSDEPKLRRIDKKAKGVTTDLKLSKKSNEVKKSDIHEITLENVDNSEVFDDESEDIHIIPDMYEIKPAVKSFIEDDAKKEEPVFETDVFNNNDSSDKDEIISKMPDPITERNTKNKAEEYSNESVKNEIEKKHDVNVKYKFPPISLLNKGEKSHSDSDLSLKETAYRLQQTLKNFNVNVTVTDISQGPTVTRFELQPEQGVKVSKIKSLEDDIKLNLATTDIRIEAPIPGKAAVGIEVPNKENASVALRDLLESKEFKNSSSNISFAVGKDIAGQVIVTDIAKMPHLLIAGATGSGKSVCINTIIMSLLYKANPNDVKMIMVDPKVVELSVYNGIPHLMIPVVTDPKKAAAALQWAVNEMNDRYQKFADYNVRDLKGYNNLAESGHTDEVGKPLAKMPQLVIIVDELADLMMVASNEVEESICRLAQLARAAGIHLIIATQRPSVDVITGLIKANMPSRIAFSVSSGIDSRTILDMNGAEKLLGKGDMLFYPQGYSKPSRVQGAFVSDKEVSDVVDYLKNQKLGNTYNDEIDEKIITSINNQSNQKGQGKSKEFDPLFADAFRSLIAKDKASIGLIQRDLQVGFNRAARIMDQLESVGAVSQEEGTKPRKILMSLEQFENLLEEI